MKLKKIAEMVVIVAVVLFITSVIVYSGTFPPVETVASESMTHSDSWSYGTLNVGDIVFVKKVVDVPGSIVSYVVGRNTGLSTYGEYGNVILYKNPKGETIIHRALFYLSWNRSTPNIQGYDRQTWIKVTPDYVLLYDVGPSHRNMVVYIGGMLNESGYVTVGDYNLAYEGIYNATLNAYEAADQNIGITNAPVNSVNIVGVAYWDIPWYGLIKLNILKLYGQWPQSNEVANNSYLYLYSSMLIIVVLALFPYSKVMKKVRRKQ